MSFLTPSTDNININNMWQCDSGPSCFTRNLLENKTTGLSIGYICIPKRLYVCMGSIVPLHMTEHVQKVLYWQSKEAHWFKIIASQFAILSESLINTKSSSHLRSPQLPLPGFSVSLFTLSSRGIDPRRHGILGLWLLTGTPSWTKIGDNLGDR